MSECIPCLEDEHDTCHNFLWSWACECQHTSWPEPLCLARKRTVSGLIFICELPTDQHPRPHPSPDVTVHEATYWIRPETGDRAGSYGWAKRPRLWWSYQTTAGPRGRFDPYDPTAPSQFDQREEVA